MRGKVLVSVLCLIVLYISFSSFPNASDGEKKYVTYDLDASDSQCYTLGELIRFQGLSFKVSGVERYTVNDLREYSICLEIDDNSFNKLQSGYTFMFANDNVVWKRSSCSYDTGLTVVEIEKNPCEPNRIVLMDNSSLNILISIDLYEKEPS